MRESPATPFAITVGDGCGVWYRTARATCSVGGVGSTNAANGASGFSVARPTSIRFRCEVDGIGPRALQAQHLAVRRHAARGQAPGDELDPAVQVVGCADVHEAALNRRFAEEHRRNRLLARECPHLRSDLRVELREGCHRAAPHDLHRAVARLQLPHCQLERAILHDEPPGEHRGEHCCSGDDPERDEHEPFAAGAEPGPDQAQREGDPAQHHQR